MQIHTIVFSQLISNIIKKRALKKLYVLIVSSITVHLYYGVQLMKMDVEQAYQKVFNEQRRILRIRLTVLEH
jgi:hypothetical protein